MNESLHIAFSKGYERMAAWSNLLDDINVYPVPDGDTGRNLRISLAPLKFARNKDLPEHLLMAATGNSGNIAGAFFSKFARIQTPKALPEAAAAGKDAAWNALADPKPGTMLTVFSSLVHALEANDIQQPHLVSETILSPMKISVLSTAEILVQLRKAKVVDAGALGMFLFFEGFFSSLTDQPGALSNPYELFGEKLKLSAPANPPDEKGYCIDTIIIPSSGVDKAIEKLSSAGNHVVSVSDGTRLKVHFHAPDASAAQKEMAGVGELLRWKSEKIERPKSIGENRSANPQSVHIVTDAAGSLTREAARDLGITLLDSYIIMDDRLLPESMLSADKLYEAMARGDKVTTAQASIFERHQHYQYLTQRFSSLLYLCVGSAYTGNFQTAGRWAAQNPGGQRMTVVNTGAASGRLGLIARTVAQYANAGKNSAQVEKYANAISPQCDELIFLDQLKYLAAGGRISKSRGFFGDLLKIKPIIRPGRRGAEKIGVVKNEKNQVEFLLDHLGKHLKSDAPAELLLQYTNNRDRVVSQIRPQIQKQLPRARINVQPMSLTSGAHMGPGTWAVAYLLGTNDAGYR